MKKRKGFWHIGSFQLPHVFESEIPLEEVWAFIARYGTKDYIKNHLHSDNPEINWEDYVNYGMVRAKQAVEFRNSAKNSTLLTKPLTLYYSFLNLTRAFLALGPEMMPTSSHGLKFEAGHDLLSSGAKIVRGTFTDYKILLHDLIYNHMNSPWYLIREVDNHPPLSRASYYFIAVFILGSIVRYEPELMLEISHLDSEVGWLIDRFLTKAERFFPQLKICEQCKTTIYF